MTHLDTIEELYFKTIEKYSESKNNPTEIREMLYKMTIRFLTGEINKHNDKNLNDKIIQIFEGPTKEFQQEIIKGY